MINPDNFLKNGLNNLLKDNAPDELSQLIFSCSSYDDLVQKLENDPPRLFAVFQNLKLEGNDPFAAKLASRLAARLLVRLNAGDLANPEVKKIETALRNRGMLDRKFESDITLKEEVGSPIVAHKAILILESPYFRTMKGYKDLQKSKLIMEDEDLEISPEAFQLVVDYLYLSDEKRETFLSTVDKSLLIHMAKLADFWLIDELKERCDEELCNSLADFNLEKEDIDDDEKKQTSWKKQAILFPRFVQLLEFISRVAEGRDLGSIIEEMHTPEGAALLATKCTPEEIQAFASLKTAFGQVCRIPPGAFGKAEWEKTYPITIVGNIPPLPPNIHAILEQEDPCEPGKKLKDTCKLFLHPEKVILHEGGVDKELVLGFDGMEELAMKVTNQARRTRYDEILLNDDLRNQMNQMPVEESRWVLMRKEVIPGTRTLDFESQKLRLKGSFEVPKVMDAILLNMITYADEGTCLYGRDPWTYTRCQEMNRHWHIIIGGFIPRGLHVTDDFSVVDYDRFGLAGVWKF